MAKVVVATGLAVAGALGFLKLLWQLEKKTPHERLMPCVAFNEYGSIKDLENFGDYVVRQLDLDRESPIAKIVAKAAEGYLRDDKSQTTESTEIACILVSGPTQEENNKEICSDMLKELDACMLAYFSFHWQHSSTLIEKVVSAGATHRRLRRAVLFATRKQRYDNVLKNLNTKRRFNTLLEELKKIRRPDVSVPDEGAVTVPAASSKRCPVILFVGGGMGAGKSTVVKEILASSFWSGVIHNAVVVEADAFKETDVIYRTLSAMSQDDIAGTAEFVHHYSTEAASSLLVSALNEGRDVIFDGTMSWEPFVVQTVEMVRDIHCRRYRMGPGYRKNSDGSVTEKYWEPLVDDSESNSANNCSVDKRRYRIEFVGVTCDAHLAVVRGMRRAIFTKRGVPVKGQLRSHKMFAQSIDTYVKLVDTARIYSTSNWSGPAELIGLKEDPDRKLLVDSDIFPAVRHLAELDTDANSVAELYNEKGDGYVNKMWKEMCLNKYRKKQQERLKTAILANAAHCALLERYQTANTRIFSRLEPSTVGRLAVAEISAETLLLLFEEEAALTVSDGWQQCCVCVYFFICKRHRPAKTYYYTASILEDLMTSNASSVKCINKDKNGVLGSKC